MRRTSRRTWAEQQARHADQALLVQRLRQLGLRGVHSVTVHENRTVLASVTGAGVLRIHRGYAYASDRVLRAVVRFADPRCSGAERDRARRSITAFPVDRYVRSRPPARRRERVRPEDRETLAELRRLHDELNQKFFGGALPSIPLRLSGRMTTRLGELTVDVATREAVEIAISRRHLRDGWEEVRHTLLHEMVHQWQAETGRPVDHGREFRRKAREVGADPTAERSAGDVVRV